MRPIPSYAWHFQYTHNQAQSKEDINCIDINRMPKDAIILSSRIKTQEGSSSSLICAVGNVLYNLTINDKLESVYWTRKFEHHFLYTSRIAGEI